LKKFGKKNEKIAEEEEMIILKLRRFTIEKIK